MRLKLKIAALSAASVLGVITGGVVSASGEDNPPVLTATTTDPNTTTTSQEPDQTLLVRAGLRRKVVYYRRQTCHWRRYAFARCQRPVYQERREQDAQNLQHLVRLWRTRYLKARRYAVSFGYAKRYLPPPQARLVGQRMAAMRYGWSGQQWGCLDKLWGHIRQGSKVVTLESGWDPLADNPGSPAHGIPQADPGKKMGPGWRRNVFVQIRWGLRYIKTKGSFSDPCSALAYRLANHSY